MGKKKQHKMMPHLSLLFSQMKWHWQMCQSRDCSGLFLYPIKPQAKRFLFQTLFTSRKKYMDLEQESQTCRNYKCGKFSTFFLNSFPNILYASSANSFQSRGVFNFVMWYKIIPLKLSQMMSFRLPN